MKKSSKVNFQLTDHHLGQIYAPKGAEILPSPQAWEKFSWSRALFSKRPREGYFVWVKKTLDFPLITCAYLSQVKTNQELENLVILEEGVKGKMFAHCRALAQGKGRRHWGRTNLILKPGAVLSIIHRHQFDEKDVVFPLVKAQVRKGAQLKYHYFNHQAEEKVVMESDIEVEEKGNVEIRISLRSLGAPVEMKERMVLRGKGARGVVRLRLVAEKNAQIKAENFLEALGAGQGHLDCQGLILSRKGKITLIPALINENKEALLTHEASIGKIKEAMLAYLRARGFSEKEAINLLVTGFLK